MCIIVVQKCNLNVTPKCPNRDVTAITKGTDTVRGEVITLGPSPKGPLKLTRWDIHGGLPIGTKSIVKEIYGLTIRYDK